MQSSDSQPMTREEYRKSEIEIIRKELKGKLQRADSKARIII